MPTNIYRNTDKQHIEPRPTGALLLTIYRDDLRAKVADAQKLDPLIKAAALEMAGILAMHEGRHRAARHYFTRADHSLAQSGRVRPNEAAA